MGQDKQAKALVDRAASIQKFPMVMMSSDTGLSAVPARYALERGAWAEAAALEVRPSTYGNAEAMTRFARAIGSARTGNLPASRAELEKLQGLRQAYAAKPDSAYWGAQTEVLADAAAGWIAHAEGRDDEALKLLRTAADLEDGAEKQVAMENRLFPVREQLGYVLLELNRPKQALAEFDHSSKSTPNHCAGSTARQRRRSSQGILPKPVPATGSC